MLKKAAMPAPERLRLYALKRLDAQVRSKVAPLQCSVFFTLRLCNNDCPLRDVSGNSQSSLRDALAQDDHL